MWLPRRLFPISHVNEDFIHLLLTRDQEPQWQMFSSQGRYAAEAYGKLLKR